MNEAKLKKTCPFCGDVVAVKQLSVVDVLARGESHRRPWFIECCDLQFGGFATLDLAAIAWNQRAVDDANRVRRYPDEVPVEGDPVLIHCEILGCWETEIPELTDYLDPFYWRPMLPAPEGDK